MKKLGIILTIVAATAMIFSSCAKYEEGPGFTILTKKARITGTWLKIEEITNGIVNKEDDKITWTFDKNGTGVATYTEIEDGIESAKSNSTEIKWEFNDSKEKLIIKVRDDDGKYDEKELEIIRLTNNELWLKDTYLTIGNLTIATTTKYKKE